MTKGFASTNDLADKTISFTELAPGRAYAYTAQGDPNTGIVVGDDGVMVIDTQATPLMAADVIARVRQVTDKPIRYVVLTHYHAVRVLGASAYRAEQIIASAPTLALIEERGRQDMDSEIGRFPRLFRGVDSVPGLTWPTLIFERSLTVRMGSLEVRISHAGRGHTQGDTIVWLPAERVLFSGDLVEYGATPYCGDAHFKDWPTTLDSLAALGAERLVPGRGDALTTPALAAEAIDQTRRFVTDLYGTVAAGVARGQGLRDIAAETMAALRPRYGSWVIFDHCMPFNLSRAFDEASGIDHPRIWTAERDVEMWRQLGQGA
ncbi:MAG: MBL fold metallo-hydrolase [Gemmatimonadetes bacterium]|nr:MBL fold metallo-hydrolase [Gemmatimonadota bacterium]